MTETLPPHVSPALVEFLTVLEPLHPERFGGALSVYLSDPQIQKRSEQEIHFRLADHAIQTWAVETLMKEGRAVEAEKLSALPPITDSESAEAAAKAAREIGGVVLHAGNAASCAATGVTEPDESKRGVGGYAALAAEAYANLFSLPEQLADKDRAYTEAVALFIELRIEARPEPLLRSTEPDE